MRRETSRAGRTFYSTSQQESNSVRPILIQGLKPVAFLVGLNLVMLILLMLTHVMIDAAHFFLLQQLIFAVVLIAWLVLTIILFVRVNLRTRRRIAMWSQHGQRTQVAAELIAFTLVAFTIVLPVILVLIFYE